MNFRPTLAWLAAAALLSACQSTNVRSAWFDTAFSGPPLQRIVVVGMVQSTADSRVLEDVLVERLRGAGVEAIAGHTVRLDDPALPEATFNAAVVGTGAQGLLLVSLLGVDTRTQVSTTMVHGGMDWGRSPWGASHRTMVPMQTVSQYDLATVETKLFHVGSQRLLWAATTTTFNPRSVAREAPGFADLVVGQLASHEIIARP